MGWEDLDNSRRSMDVYIYILYSNKYKLYIYKYFPCLAKCHAFKPSAKKVFQGICLFLSRETLV